MEQITKRDGIFYYGEEQCQSVDHAYRKFRKDYHEGLGRQVHGRLDRLGSRKERIHGYGFVFSEEVRPKEYFLGHGRVPYTMSLVVLCYCRFIGYPSYAHISDGDFEHWLDWAFSKGNGILRLALRKDKAGRTSKRLHTRYR